MFKHRLKHCSRIFRNSNNSNNKEQTQSFHSQPTTTKHVQTENNKHYYHLLKSNSNDWTSAGLNIFASHHSSNMGRVPLRDCINRIHIGDMELGGVNADKIGTQFKTIDEVQSMIRHLQKLEEDMMKSNGQVNGKEFCKSFEDLALLDPPEYQIDENVTEWLIKIPGSKKSSAKDLETDESFIDSGLLNVRHALLNFIKSAIIDEKSAKLTNSPRFNSGFNTINHNHYQRKPSPPMSAAIAVSTASPPTLFQGHTFSPRTSALEIVPITTTVPSTETSPVSSASANKSSFEFLSPNYNHLAHALHDRHDRHLPDTNNLYFSTPSGKNIVDSRTYTRPKKNRLPLETFSDHHDLPVSPIRVVQPDVQSLQLEPLEVETNHHTKNMNETFVANDDMESQRIQSEVSPPRRVTRNLSYVIRRDSESPNNNSPVHHSENIENIAVDLNSTFVRTREGTYSPSPTGSSNSIHTSSMEELHNLARMQEQTLRMSSNSKMLTRKETHTIVRGQDQPTLRPINKPPVDSQIPGQPKMRIQSRIPAPGAGSRIRPPMNGTRRPLTSGGIRRAPDWHDEGAY